VANQVYVNGREIACKAAAGKSAAAFPDTCLSPPSPPAGPVPIPYPNTSYASDTTNGSTTVMISGKEIMLKDASVFKKSTGNEAATKSLGMGVVTHTIQGEASFVSWSMDVKIEGQNADRHLDQMMHNEMCSPANTCPWLYIDEAATGKTDECSDVRSAVNSNCSEDEFAAGSPECSPACCEAKKCVCSPYGSNPKCCDEPPPDGAGPGGQALPKTKHHIVPDHCFKAPGDDGDYYGGIENMSYGQGLAICVPGEDKADEDAEGELLDHGKIHDAFDRIENQYRAKGGKWQFSEAAAVGADVCGHYAQCDKKCLQQQTEQYYKKKNVNPGTNLRADASGRKRKGMPKASELGNRNANWSNRFG
jgi:Domain of unknown function (DUF4150)